MIINDIYRTIRQMTTKHKNVNWKKVEDHYRAGLITLLEIAKRAGITEGAIRRRAKANGWKRDLTARVRARTSEKLTLSLAGQYECPPEPDRTPEEQAKIDDDLVEAAAQTQVAIVREHTAAIRYGRQLTQRLMGELAATTASAAELAEMLNSETDDQKQKTMQRAISLSSRAAVMRDLANAARVWVGLERQAFRISDERTREDRDAAIEQMSADELRASIMQDMVALRLLPPPAPQGIANRPPRREEDD